MNMSKIDGGLSNKYRTNKPVTLSDLPASSSLNAAFFCEQFVSSYLRKVTSSRVEINHMQIIFHLS